MQWIAQPGRSAVRVPPDGQILLPSPQPIRAVPPESVANVPGQPRFRRGKWCSGRLGSSFPGGHIIALLRRASQDRFLPISFRERRQKHWLPGAEIRTVTRARRILDLVKIGFGFRGLEQYDFAQSEPIFRAKDPEKELRAYLIEPVAHVAMRGDDGEEMPSRRQQFETVPQCSRVIEDVFQRPAIEHK